MDLLRNSRQDEYTRFREAIEIFRREGVTDVLEEHDVICEVFLIHKFLTTNLFFINTSHSNDNFNIFLIFFCKYRKPYDESYRFEIVLNTICISYFTNIYHLSSIR